MDFSKLLKLSQKIHMIFLNINTPSLRGSPHDRIPRYLNDSYLQLSCLYCIAELKENVRELEEWFKEAESVLREPLKFNQMWTRTAIDAKMEEIQVGEATY